MFPTPLLHVIVIFLSRSFFWNRNLRGSTNREFLKRKLCYCTADYLQHRKHKLCWGCNILHLVAQRNAAPAYLHNKSNPNELISKNSSARIIEQRRIIYRAVTHGILSARLFCMRNTESSATSRMACTAAGIIVRDDRNLMA